MALLKMSRVYLFWLYLMSSQDLSGCCFDAVWQLPRLSIRHLQAMSDKQSLTVSWQLNHSSLVEDVYEIQIGRTENNTITYNRIFSVPIMDSHNHTWTSDLPLECVDHSVRIRLFYNQSVWTPWSDWKTNKGYQGENGTKIFPSGQVLREGTSAMFCCVPPRGVNITSITINNIKHPLISISDRVKAILVENLTKPETIIDALLINCSDNTGTLSRTWNYLSSPPQKPRNFSCVTADMKTITCSWRSDRKPERDKHNKKTYTLQIQNSDQAPILCEQLSCTFSAIPQLEEYNIRVVVKDTLGEETESYSFNISDRVSPSVEWYTISPQATDSTVSWFTHGNLTQMSLLCQVTTVPESTKEIKCSSVSGFCKAKLEHLLPNTRYTARVRCSADGKLWGQWTKPEAFKTDPLVTLDVWRRIKQLPEANSRQVTLVWIPLVPGSAASVNIKGYKVQWSLGGKNQQKDSRQTQATLPVGPGQCDFSVLAEVDGGFSIPAHITVPQRDDQEKKTSETRLSSSSAAGFNVSWEHDENATCGYTVDWCILGNVEPCILQWVKVPQNKNSVFLPGKDFKPGCRYAFNIFGCRENGHQLLEIQTGYLQELQSVLPPSLVELVQRTSSSVTLEWRFNENDASHPAFITGYFISVQEVQEVGTDKLSGHASDLFNVSVEDPHRKSVTIDGLQQNQEYAFSVSALTKDGPGQATTITVRTKTNYSAYMVEILTPTLLLLGCTLLLWSQRKMLQKGLKGILFYPTGMDIKAPELDSFLQETGERLQSQKPEECRCCDIEILSRPFLNETLTQRDPEPPPDSQSYPLTQPHSCVPLRAEYCPQLWNRAAPQYNTSISNESYFHTPEEGLSGTESMISDNQSSFKLSEGPNESCHDIYGYISNET
ncbi:leukemia inhibitory factor receptor-like isoform X2 [Cheilinus undulatus]|uniref:leukemia inhibitory factor receptor-like isoform X2 n=1 Tax=Cheilinus undulatus TaxID=241271 RepID=UPI001BD699B4|nr:leukemia inhibitory factor receptor-like isoform X2 [Cheilinus undulatus]